MRVLVVGDVKYPDDVVVSGLRHHGMAVDVAYDGCEAAFKLDINDYEVVVLDREPQGLNGDSLCQLITGNEYPAMVLMLSAAAAPEDRVAGLGLGADDYLTKPFHFPELVLRVRALARRRPGAQSRVFRVGDVELDPLRHTVRRANRQLTLSVKEFGVLEALMRCDGAALSAERLLERVWDEHADPFTNTVLVTVSRLRRKLGGPPIIETVPGVGYRITDPVMGAGRMDTSRADGANH